MNRISALLVASATLLASPLAFAQTSEVEDNPISTEAKDPRLEIGGLKLKLSGVIFALWGIDLEEANPNAPSPNGANRFDLTRAYINIESQISETISLRLTPDITRVSGTDGNIDGSLALRIKYAYARFSDVLPGVGVKAGVQETPWIGFEDSVWGYRVLGPAALEFFTGVSSADLGVGVEGKHLEGLLEYQVVLANGEGYSRAESRDREAAKYKEVGARITFAPLAPGGGAFKNLKFSAFSQYGINRSVDDQHVERIRALAAATLQHSLFTAGVSAGPTWDGQVDELGDVSNRQGLLVSSFGHVNLPLQLRAIARYDWYDPDVDTSDDASSRLIAGLAYRFNDKVQVIADYQAYGYQDSQKAPENLAGKVFFVHLEAKY